MSNPINVFALTILICFPSSGMLQSANMMRHQVNWMLSSSLNSPQNFFISFNCPLPKNLNTKSPEDN